MNLNKYASSVTNHQQHQYLHISTPDHTLPDHIKDELIPQVQLVASLGFNREVTHESAINHSLTDKDHLFLVTSKVGDLIAFFSTESYHYVHGRGEYLSGIAVLPQYQGQGIARYLIQQAFNLPHTQFVGTTQSPVIYQLFQEHLPHLYPSLDLSTPPYHLTQIAQEILKNRRGAFNPGTFVVTGLYSTCLYSHYPWSKNGAINQFFLSRLNYTQPGYTTDGFILIGEK